MHTTDDLQAIFDIVDTHDRVVGQATRKECNSNPDLIHRAVFVLVYNDQRQILWQRRSQTKDVSPGKWVTSASGHVDAGEAYDDTAIREVREELGIDLSIEFLGKFLYRYPRENEYSAVYRAFSNGPFRPNTEEVSAIRFMSIDEILEKQDQGGLELSEAVHYIIDSLGLR